MLTCRGNGAADGERTEDHHDGPDDNQQLTGRVCVRQLPENKRAPCQAPNLIGVGERYASANAQVLRCELLKQVANDPDESAQEKPEQQVDCLR
jgi:hypothetical protein